MCRWRNVELAGFPMRFDERIRVGKRYAVYAYCKVYYDGGRTKEAFCGMINIS